jgi:hypothetical protein
VLLQLIEKADSSWHEGEFRPICFEGSNIKSSNKGCWESLRMDDSLRMTSVWYRWVRSVKLMILLLFFTSRSYSLSWIFLKQQIVLNGKMDSMNDRWKMVIGVLSTLKRQFPPKEQMLISLNSICCRGKFQDICIDRRPLTINQSVLAAVSSSRNPYPWFSWHEFLSRSGHTILHSPPSLGHGSPQLPVTLMITLVICKLNGMSCRDYSDNH